MSTPPKARPATAPLAFTGNRLRDGRVAWLGEGGIWVDRVAEARIFPPEQAAEGLALAQQGEAAQLVVGVYGVELLLAGGVPVPAKYRERLRAAGPSVAAEPAEWRMAS
ncbi:DUF2849 domain-containing protein [Siccirubricoccus phaeus]|uniref:DUF2849 domain-containing protein n=1 Tax=Siccirubricoccus phaeus TaxID=2595053 RepID=UPI0011F26B04|nr:DUF2849 domain-containing protein [Siccirubricoccus phaeus]